LKKDRISENNEHIAFQQGRKYASFQHEEKKNKKKNRDYTKLTFDLCGKQNSAATQ